jgi:Ser/Thr protein kinase RdoA (MazF antagonist)
VEQRIRERFSDAVLHTALERFGGRDAELLDGFESYMYTFSRDRERLILRIGHSIRRSEELILGEVDWINYLARGGASVARAVLSRQGRLVEPIDDGHGGRFLATGFVRAEGVPPRRCGWTDELVKSYGELIGRMHTLSLDYEPADPAWRRPHWNDPLMLDVERFLPEDDREVRSAYREVIERIGTLPVERASYGLIHQDAHGGNFLVDDQGRITLFDFDDCIYCWYAFDIAMVLFYRVAGNDDPEGTARSFLPVFLSGYRRTARLDPTWLRWLPDFMTLREIDLYALIHRSFDVERIDDPWCARWMEGRAERIAARRPFIELDSRELILAAGGE